MKILVTGGAGFVGSNYVRSLCNGPLSDLRRNQVTALDALTYAGDLAKLAAVRAEPSFKFVHGDITDVRLVDELVAGQDAVVHFAAESHVDRSIDYGARFVRTNTLGTQVLLEAAVRHKVSRFVHISTDEVYGSVKAGSWDEQSPVQPNSPYSASKASSDLLALAYHHTHGLNVSVTRSSNNYGPYQNIEKAIPLFITQLLRGRKIPLYGDGKNIREWLHVDDHCRAVHAVVHQGRPGHIYNIGGGQELTNRELVERLLRLCGAGWESVEHVRDRKGHDRRYSVNWSKIHDELGYSPWRSLEDGLAETVEWYRENRDWWVEDSSSAANV